MSDVNPYSAPDASLDTGQEARYQPKIFAFNGRIGRMRYLAYSIGINFLLMAVMVPLASATAFMGGGPGTSVIGMAGFGAFSLATIVISIMFAKRRLNDLNRSGWWFLLFILPLVNLILAIYLIFFPGAAESNDFGPPPVKNSIGVLILGWSLPVLFLVGIVAAIAIPAYQGFLGQVQ